MRPLLLLDVDGVLNPLGGKQPQGFDHYDFLGYDVYLSQQHGKWLNDLTDFCDLTWATTWEDDANHLIGPAIGLPKLPVIHFEHASLQDMTYKLKDVSKYVGEDRAVIWLDDDLFTDAFQWAKKRPGATLLIRQNPKVGLTEESIAGVWRFLIRLDPRWRPFQERLFPGMEQLLEDS